MLSYLIKKSLASIFLSASALTGAGGASTTPATLPPVQTTPVVQECTDKACVTELIREYARFYGVDENYALAVAKCESEFKTTAVGDGGRARGVFQFHKPTFDMFAKKMGQGCSVRKHRRQYSSRHVGLRARQGLPLDLCRESHLQVMNY